MTPNDPLWPSDPERQIKESVRKLREAAKDAFAVLRNSRDYPSVRLKAENEIDGIKASIASTLPNPALPSPERLSYALRVLDIWAGAYLNLVSTRSDYESYSIVLKAMTRQAWERYRGILAIEPIGQNQAMQEIEARARYWYKESLKRLIVTPQSEITAEPPQERAVPNAPHAETIAHQLKRLRDSSRLTIEQLADSLGIDQRSVERHLSGQSIPRISHIGAYERVFSKGLQQKVLIYRTPGKRR